MRSRTRLVLAAFLLLASTLRAGAADKIPDGYERRDVEGFTVYVGVSVLHQPNDGFGQPTLTCLERELNDLKRILHPKIVGILQGIPIWVEWDFHDRLSPPGAVARYFSGSADELKKAGGDPRKAHNIEVISLRTLAWARKPGTALQQIVILHEMAHAVHHRLLGWDNPELEAIYQQAMERKLYDKVNDRFGRRGPAYARTNPREYFAEISCAYLDSCNYFPFNHEQLHGHDALGFKFVKRVWQEPDRFSVIAVKTDIDTGSKGGTTTTHSDPRNDTFSERDAMLKLDQLRAMLD